MKHHSFSWFQSMSEPTTPTEGPVTVVVSRSVKPGREQDFEAWLKGTIEALTQYPGYQGANIVRPDAHPATSMFSSLAGIAAKTRWPGKSHWSVRSGWRVSIR